MKLMSSFLINIVFDFELQKRTLNCMPYIMTYKHAVSASIIVYRKKHFKKTAKPSTFFTVLSKPSTRHTVSVVGKMMTFGMQVGIHFNIFLQVKC